MAQHPDRRLPLTIYVCLLTLLALRPAVAGAQGLLALPVAANHIVYDPLTRKIYASVGSRGQGAMANSITVIDPRSGNVERSIFIGSEPGELIVSDKSKYLYVSVSDGATIRRFNLQTQTAGSSFSVGDGIAAARLAAVPGAPEAVAIMRQRGGVFPNNEGLAVYVNGLPKKSMVNPGHQLAAGISPSRMFGYENMISSWDFVTINLSPEGAVGAGSTGGLMQGNASLAGSANGLIITGGGKVIDPEARQVIGSLPGIADPLLAHSPTGAVFSVSGDNGRYKIKAADLRTMSSLGEFPLEVQGIHGGPGNLISCGDNCLAFHTSDSVVIVPFNMGTRLPQVDLSVKRSKFPVDIARGAEFTYLLTVTNNGATASSDAFVTDQLPAGVEPEDLKASQGDVSCANQIVRAEFGPLPAGRSATVSIKVRVKSTENLVFTAVVRGNEPDPNTDNNIEIHDSAFRLADLTVDWEGIRQATNGAGVDLRIVLEGAVIVRNIGAKPSGACALRFWIGDGPNFVPSFYTMLQEVPIPELRPGESYRAVLSAPLARQDDATGSFVFAHVDARNEVEEKTKENNVARIKVQ